MREIKFRAWTKGTWIYDGMVYDWQDTIFPEAVGFQPDDIPIMQYTGLKDKNRKEIYEGDILTWDNGFFFIVKYQQGRYIGSPSLGNEVPGYLSNDFFYQSQIIGNIHENPELLK